MLNMQAWELTQEELDAQALIELPERHLMTSASCSGGGLFIDLSLCVSVNVDVDADVSLGGDCRDYDKCD